MKFLANENFPLNSTKYLRDNGHDVLAIGTDFMGITDREIIDLSNKDSRTILTFDADYVSLFLNMDLSPLRALFF